MPPVAKMNPIIIHQAALRVCKVNNRMTPQKAIETNHFSRRKNMKPIIPEEKVILLANNNNI